ncbi:unnamed protein product [Allacma fusca]|uniref:Uncharacterized protein n=1 Tax=Allacma fusca TaxID=39272 RepID=A0A8J2KPL4_9HEXA|nr:unnamed protein product [Allacma fusca]
MEEDVITPDLNESSELVEVDSDSEESQVVMYDYLFNVIIVGDSGVGKTDLIGRLCDEAYQTKFVTTMGMNVESHTLCINDKKIKLQLWDPSGSEKYLHLTKKYFSNASGIIYVYDVSYARSFHNIVKWMDLVGENTDANLPKVLVGNKCDTGRRAVTKEQAERLADASGMIFMETSAISGHNVTQVFSSLCQVMIPLYDKKFPLEQ